MTGLRIKNLAIAMEALSRINSEGDALDRVRDLLKDAISEEETYTPPKAQPRHQDLDDEISF